MAQLGSSTTSATSSSQTTTSQTTSQTTTTVQTTTETTSTGDISECPVGTTPVDSVGTPTPPSENGPLARIADAPPGATIATAPTVPNPYCSYRAKYTKAEKAAATQWSTYYSLQSAYKAKASAALSVFAAALATDPDPTISKGLALVEAGQAALAAVQSADASANSTVESTVANDPTDPDWRTIAAPLRTHPNRIARLPGATAAQQAAYHAYVAAALSSIANGFCVTEAINRASTALTNADPAVAKAQYAAGAKCAATGVVLTRSLSRLLRSRCRC